MPLTPEKQARLDLLLSKLSPEDRAELGLEPKEQAKRPMIDAKTGEVLDSTFDPSVANMFMKPLQALGRVTDYAGGVVRGPLVAAPLEAVTGEDVFRGDEYKAALNPLSGANYPSSADLLNRAGAGHRPGVGVAGLAMDLATDPLSYLSGGASEGARALNIPAREIEKRGVGMWRSAFKNLDTEALKKGKMTPPSQIMQEAGIRSWGARGINTQMAKLAEDLLGQRDAILAQATKLGATVSPEASSLYLKEMAGKYLNLRDSSAKELGKVLLEEADNLEKSLRPERDLMTRQITREAANPSEASDLKSYFYKGVTPKNWEPYAMNPTLSSEKNIAKSKGLKESTEQAVGQTLGKDAEKKLIDTNDKLGSLLSTRKKELGEVSKAEAKNLFTAVDALQIGTLGALEASPELTLKAIALKKLADALNLQGVRSQAGSALQRFGTGKVTGPAFSGVVRRIPYYATEEEK